MKNLFTLALVFSFFSVSYAKTVPIAAANYSFSPQNVTINIGDVVTWTSEGSHNVISGTSCTADGKFASGTLNTANTFSFTFTSAGTFPYYCSFHCSMGMTGTIIVSTTAGVENAVTLPNIYKAFPNPFAETTTLSYDVAKAGKVNIDVTAITGQKVLSIAANQAAGAYNQVIDLTQVAKGVYVLHISVDGIPAKETILVKE